MTTAMSPIDRQALLQALREDPTFREEARTLLLSAEVLKLPEQIAALNARLDRFILAQEAINAEQREFNAAQREFNAEQQEFNAAQREFNAEQREFNAAQREFNAEQREFNRTVELRLSRLEDQVADLTVQVANLTIQVANLTTQVADLARQVANLTERMDNLTTEVGDLQGFSLEFKVQGSIQSLIYRRLKFKGSRILKSQSVPAKPSFYNFLEDAIDRNLITEDDAGQLLAADLLLRARLPNSTEEVYVAVEVSRTVADDDITRARERADLLAAAAGKESRAVVIGTVIPEPQRQLAEALGVAIFQED